MKTILTAALFCAAVLFCGAARLAAGEKPLVFFVHGWTPGYQPKNTSPVPLFFKEKFAGHEIGVRAWDSSASFLFFARVVGNADRFAPVLADEIAAMPPERQRNLTLVGHSLGARIIIRTAALLRRRNVVIRQFVLLGAAIDDDAPEIVPALEATLLPNVNIYNPEDGTLSCCYRVYNLFWSKALGVDGYPGTHPKLRQYRVGDDDRVSEKWHSPANYLKRLLKIDLADPPPDDPPRR